MSITISFLSENQFDVYERYLESKDEALFYHSIKYMKLLESTINGAKAIYLIAINESNEINGVLPLFEKDGPLGKVYNSLPFYGSNGGSIADSDYVFDKLFNYYSELTDAKNVCSSTIVENFSMISRYDETKFNMTDYRVSQVTKIDNIDNHEEKLMCSFHSKTRNMIRKAEKSDVKVCVDNDCFDFLYNTHVENLESLGGKAKSNLFIKNIDKYFDKGKDYKIYVAYKDNIPVSALLLFYYKKYVEYYMPVVKKEFRSLQSLSKIIYTAMIDASKNGYCYWNWGGTWPSQDGVYRFKKRF